MPSSSTETQKTWKKSRDYDSSKNYIIVTNFNENKVKTKDKGIPKTGFKNVQQNQRKHKLPNEFKNNTSNHPTEIRKPIQDIKYEFNKETKY